MFSIELTYPFVNTNKYLSCHYKIRRWQNRPKKASPWRKPSSRLMLSDKMNEKRCSKRMKTKKDNTVNETDSNRNEDTKFKLPKLKAEQLGVENENIPYRLKFSTKNTELPKLPAQEYIDNFRREASVFECNLVGNVCENFERRQIKRKTQELRLLPRINENSSLLTANIDRLVENDQFRFPKIQKTKEDGRFTDSRSKKKRKLKNYHENSTKNVSRRKSVENNGKQAALKAQTKWCNMTFQSNIYD